MSTGMAVDRRPAGGVGGLRGCVVAFPPAPEWPHEVPLTVHRDGVVLWRDGTIVDVGPAAEVLARHPADVAVTPYNDALILPGFIDTHIHLPQSGVIASWGAQLLDWLERYTFPAEMRFADPRVAEAGARFFCDELLRNGTTTAVAYATVAPQSVEALFAEALSRGMRMIAGKVMMDRNAPEGLLDTAQSSYDDSKALIARWHGRGRLAYAVTPRFAITSTPAQLDAAGALLREHPDVYLQTHLSENRDEIATVARLFPDARHYTDVYARHGLLGPRSILGHCIHLASDEIALMADTASVAALCPSSNLFIGSGLFDLAALSGGGVRTALATDVGGGTSFSMLRALQLAYKVMQLRGMNLTAAAGFHWITRGNSAALGLADRIGTLAVGSEADCVVLDPKATPLLRHRLAAGDGSIEDMLFALMMLGDDRVVRATYVAGRKAHDRGARPA
jgi:guanine deaminase